LFKIYWRYELNKHVPNKQKLWTWRWPKMVETCFV
jgi:hypothetical protein